MRFLKVWVLVLGVLMGATFMACGDKKNDVKPESITITTTLGKELLDLDQAYKDGIITQKEYEETKQKLIEQRTKLK